MNLRALQKHWNSLGRQDPLRAILARAERGDASWDAEKFFRTGVAEIDAVLHYAESIHPLRQKKSALDFGCGVGRLTQALASHFEQVCGVDIAPAMIEHARRYNRYASGCEYLVNETGDLSRFSDGQFDFVYSSITLQHMPARFAKKYIAEFVRVLSPAGLLLFQLPSKRTSTMAQIRSLTQQILDPIVHPLRPHVVMRGIAKQEVVQLLIKHGGEVLDIASDESAGPTWESFRYLARKSSPRVTGS